MYRFSDGVIVSSEDRHYSRLKFWAQKIKERQQKGLTVKEWCRKNCVTVGYYNHWVHLIRREAPEFLEEFEDTYNDDVIALWHERISGLTLKEWAKKIRFI